MTEMTLPSDGLPKPRLILRLFGIVIFAAALPLVDIKTGWHKLFVPSPIICVGAPALMAALHGFASQIEVERRRQRSKSMVALLRKKSDAIKSLDSRIAPNGTEAVWGLAAEAVSVASLMVGRDGQLVAYLPQRRHPHRITRCVG